MGYKVSRPAEPKAGVGPGGIALAVLLLVALAWGLKQWQFPTYDPCQACEQTGLLACGAPGCVHGKVRCPRTCLKRDDPGWQAMAVEGHNPNELWMRFDNDPEAEEDWIAWTQGHIGQLIEKENGAWVNKGVCPTCQGTSLAPCPVCHAEKHCPVCAGQGRLRRWGFT